MKTGLLQGCNMQRSNLNKEFICPITQEIMSDPVVLSSGTSCERKAAEIWLMTHKNNTDPVTNERLENKTMTPNKNLKSLIIKWQAEHKPPSSLPPVLFLPKKEKSTVQHVASEIWQNGLRANLYRKSRI